MGSTKQTASDDRDEKQRPTHPAIDLSNNYQFRVHKMASIINPQSLKEGLVAYSYFTYGTWYQSLAFDYVYLVSERIDREMAILKKYPNLAEATKDEEYIKAHSATAFEMYKLQTIFTNACLALELFLKAALAYKELYIDIDSANTALRRKYGHNLLKMAKHTSDVIALSDKDLKNIQRLNAMYSGMKRFQYPHKFLKGAVDKIPDLEDVVTLNNKVQIQVKKVVGA